MTETSPTETYTLPLHDALPIYDHRNAQKPPERARIWPPDDQVDAGGEHRDGKNRRGLGGAGVGGRSEEHTSELQSRLHLVCRLLLVKIKVAQRFCRLP